jgi:hypothetical protein
MPLNLLTSRKISRQFNADNILFVLKSVDNQKRQPVVSGGSARIAFLSRQERLDALILLIPQNPPHHLVLLCKTQDMTRKRGG